MINTNISLSFKKMSPKYLYIFIKILSILLKKFIITSAYVLLVLYCEINLPGWVKLSKRKTIYISFFFGWQRVTMFAFNFAYLWLSNISGALSYLCLPKVVQTVKHLPAMRENWVLFLGWEDPLEKEMEIHSSIPAWKVLWTEEPGRL